MRFIYYILGTLLTLGSPMAMADKLDDYQAWKVEVLREFSKSPIDEQGTTTYAYGEDTPQMRNLINKRSIESNAFIAVYGNDPILWWIIGRYGQLKHSLYHIDLKAAGKPYLLSSPENQALIKKYQSYYRKALDLNEKNDAPVHLTAEMLTTMGTDVLAAPDIQQRALERNMQLAREGNVQTENENYEWELSQFVLANYAEQKDYENYLKTVNEMIERFPNSSRMHELLEYKRQAESAIEKRDREAADIEGQKR